MPNSLLGVKDSRPYDAYDTGELLTKARMLGNGKSALDDDVTRLRNERTAEQLVQLVQALGLDLNHHNVWLQAFLKLAQIHYGVGRLIHRRVPRTDLVSSKELHDDYLIALVSIKKQQGMTEREAVRAIAAAKMIPHRERRGGVERSQRGSTEARYVAVWRRYLRAKKHPPGTRVRAPDRLLRVLGNSGSAFEQVLYFLENSPPEPPFTGDSSGN